MNNSGINDSLSALLGGLVPSNNPQPQPQLPATPRGILEHLASVNNANIINSAIPILPSSTPKPSFPPAGLLSKVIPSSPLGTSQPSYIPVKLLSKAPIKLINPNKLTATSAQTAYSDEIESSIKDVLNNPLTVIKTNSIPRRDDIGLREGKLVESAVLYIDIRDSTNITESHTPEVAAKIYKAYLESMVSIARYQGGHVRGFAGDKIMVIFDNNRDAVRRAVNCAIMMQSFIEQKLNPALQTALKHPIACGIGIDYGKMVAVRGGIRNNNEIIWAGKPANIASKLADSSPGGAIDITFKAMNRIKNLPTAKQRYNLKAAKTLLGNQGGKFVTRYRLANVRYTL